jgi:hypothetical protein
MRYLRQGPGSCRRKCGDATAAVVGSAVQRTAGQQAPTVPRASPAISFAHEVKGGAATGNLRSQAIPIIADVPTANPQLGFAEYAEALCDAIRGGLPPQFTVGIYGAWGSGKTSLLRAMEKELSSDSNVIIVFFDAWRYERTESVVVPLLYAVYSALKASTARRATEAVKRGLTSLVDSMTLQIGVAGVSLKDLRRGLIGGSDLDALDTAFAKPFAELQAIGAALEGRRVVVLIDDLDRCSPGKVVTLLEALNLVLDIRGFIFVLALDYDVLTRAVHEKFPYAEGSVFIEKMVQVPFRVPRLNLEGDDALPDLVPEWHACVAQLPPSFPSLVREISRLALDANPRQIKRLVNSVLVLNRIVETSVRQDAEAFDLLVALVGLQLRWPDDYRRFSEMVFSADEPTVRLELLSEPADTPLYRYASRLLNKEYPVETLQHLLQFTEAVVASPPESEPTRPTPEAPKRTRQDYDTNKAALLARLEASGFKLGANTSMSYYSPSHPGVRFKLTTQRLRLEARGRGAGRPWALLESFSIRTDLDAALAAVADPAARRRASR